MRRLLLFLLLLHLVPAWADDRLQEQAFEEVPSLNTGLRDFKAIAEANLDTPERALSYFVTQAKAGHFDRASYALNLSRLTPQDQQARGPLLSHQLFEVMDRHLGFPFAELPDRSDGQLPPAVGAEQTLAANPRKDFYLGSLPVKVGEFEVHMVRYRSGDLKDVWLFAPTTVQRIGEAYELHGPSSWEEYVPGILRYRPVGQSPVWAWLLLAVVLGLSYGASRAMGTWLKRHFNYRLIARLHGGVNVALTTWITNALLLPWAPLPGIVSYGLLIVGFCAVVWLLSTTMSFYSEQIVRGDIDSVKDLDDRDHQEQKQQLTYLSVGRRLLSFLVLSLGVGLVALNTPQFKTVGVSLLASAGVLSVLLGVAAQPVLGNILAGVQIAISRPIRVGDAIDYEGTWCYVEEITYMYVLCCTWDEKRLVVPLRYFVSKPFSSYSLRDPYTLRVVEFNLDYLVDVDDLRKEYERLASEHELWFPGFEPKVEVISCNNDTVTVRLMVAGRNASDSWDLHCDIREGMLSYLRTEQRHALPRLRFEGRSLAAFQGRDNGSRTPSLRSPANTLKSSTDGA